MTDRLEQVLDRAARRLLEQLYADPVSASSGADNGPVHSSPDHLTLLVNRESAPIITEPDSQRRPKAA